jgi:predicted PurR-regulated permease PerM
MNTKQWSLPLRYIVLGILVVLSALGLWYIRSVLEPLIIAAFVAYLINPGVNMLTRRTKLSRRASVNIVFSFSLLLLVGAPASMTLFLDEAQRIMRDISNLFDELIVWLVHPYTIAGYPINFGQVANRLVEFRSTLLPKLTENALQLLEQTSMGALWIIVTLVAVYYLLSAWPQLREKFIHSFPDDLTPELEELYSRIRTVWMNYLRGQILLMLIVGVVFTIAWTIIGIPGALALGIVAGFLTLIPDVGPFLAAMLAIGVALLEGSSWIPLSSIWVGVIVLGVYLVLIGIKNFWLRPYIMGRSVHMPEPLVFVFIIMATVLWGILGALLVIPVSASIMVIFDYLRRRVLGMSPFPEPSPEAKSEAPISPVKNTRTERKLDKK